MYVLKAIFGAIAVVGDFLWAMWLFALRKVSGRIVPPPSPTPKDGTGGKKTS